MLNAISGAVMNNLTLIGGTVIVGTLLIWAVKDAREEEDYRDAAEKTRDRARKYTGGALGILGVFAYGLLGTMYETGMSMAEILDMLLDIVANDPAMFAGLFTAIGGALGISGLVNVDIVGFVIFVAVVFGSAVLIRRRSEEGQL
jgi:hypothetical protein